MQSKSKIVNLDRGMVPPQATDIETAILGAMLIDKKAVDEGMLILRESDVFYKPAHQTVFDAVKNLYNTGRPVDLLTVSKELRAMGELEKVGGDFFVIGLTQGIASSAHIDYHCRIIMQEYIKRRVIMMNSQITALCYDESTDVFELLENYQRQADALIDITATGRNTVTLPVALDNLKKEIEVLSANTDEVPLVGLTTGFKTTDAHTGGYRKQNLVIVAARPGMGKTAKVLKTAVENLKKNIAVGFISLEMSAHELTSRMVAIDTDFHLGQLLKKGFDKPKYFQRYDMHAERIKKYPFLIDDSGQKDITEIVIMARMWRRVHGIELLVVDYLQLMVDGSIKGNREAEISSISRRFKSLAKELDIPVVVLSQLSRAVETRGGSKRPQLSDLRDSGAIEQDADIVEFIYRPGYYKIDVIEDDYDDPKHRNAIALGANTEIDYAKYRGGSTGVAMLKWVGDKTKFVDVTDDNDVVEYIDKPLPMKSPGEAFDDEKTVFDAD